MEDVVCSIPANVEADGPVNIARYVSKYKLRSPAFIRFGLEDIQKRMCKSR